MKYQFDKTDLAALLSCGLFGGLTEAEILAAVSCVGKDVMRYGRREMILSEGGAADFIGVVLSGGVQISRVDIDGHKEIIGLIGPKDIFAEAFVCAGERISPVSAAAEGAGAKVLRIDYTKLTAVCPSACGFHSQIIKNLVTAVARKNLYLQKRLEILSRRTTREKLAAYYQAFGQGAAHSLTHEELADYLCLNRSAMSREISCMKKEGIFPVR